jgi:cytochrome c5
VGYHCPSIYSPAPFAPVARRAALESGKELGLQLKFIFESLRLRSRSTVRARFACAAGVCALLILTAGATHAGEPAESSGNRAAAGNGSSVFPAAPERDLVVRTCTACHAPELVIAKRHTPEEWDDIIAKMVDRGAQANDTEQQQILAYLVRFFGPSQAAAPSNAAAPRALAPRPKPSNAFGWYDQGR